ncbi:MAG: S-layer homology domain-containing protein [Candidatus Peregrinibacteria bacterium]|nr:S-layer homology domain-containing protein [Candidatus Peregrinibacteria bacterium]
METPNTPVTPITPVPSKNPSPLMQDKATKWSLIGGGGLLLVGIFSYFLAGGSLFKGSIMKFDAGRLPECLEKHDFVDFGAKNANRATFFTVKPGCNDVQITSDDQKLANILWSHIEAKVDPSNENIWTFTYSDNVEGNELIWTVDGKVRETNEKVQKLTFKTEGEHKVSVSKKVIYEGRELQSSNGKTASIVATKSITIEKTAAASTDTNKEPALTGTIEKAVFTTVQKADANGNVEVTFSKADLPEYGTATSYKWTFSDGTISTSQYPVLTFKAADLGKLDKATVEITTADNKVVTISPTFKTTVDTTATKAETSTTTDQAGAGTGTTTTTTTTDGATTSNSADAIMRCIDENTRPDSTAAEKEKIRSDCNSQGATSVKSTTTSASGDLVQKCIDEQMRRGSTKGAEELRRDCEISVENSKNQSSTTTTSNQHTGATSTTSTQTSATETPTTTTTTPEETPTTVPTTTPVVKNLVADFICEVQTPTDTNAYTLKFTDKSTLDGASLTEGSVSMAYSDPQYPNVFTGVTPPMVLPSQNYQVLKANINQPVVYTATVGAQTNSYPPIPLPVKCPGLIKIDTPKLTLPGADTVAKPSASLDNLFASVLFADVSQHSSDATIKLTEGNGLIIVVDNSKPVKPNVLHISFKNKNINLNLPNPEESSYQGVAANTEVKKEETPADTKTQTETTTVTTNNDALIQKCITNEKTRNPNGDDNAIKAKCEKSVNDQAQKAASEALSPEDAARMKDCVASKTNAKSSAEDIKKAERDCKEAIVATASEATLVKEETPTTDADLIQKCIDEQKQRGSKKDDTAIKQECETYVKDSKTKTTTHSTTESTSSQAAIDLCVKQRTPAHATETEIRDIKQACIEANSEETKVTEEVKVDAKLQEVINQCVNDRTPSHATQAQIRQITEDCTTNTSPKSKTESSAMTDQQKLEECIKLNASNGDANAVRQRCEAGITGVKNNLNDSNHTENKVVDTQNNTQSDTQKTGDTIVYNTYITNTPNSSSTPSNTSSSTNSSTSTSSTGVSRGISKEVKSADLSGSQVTAAKPLACNNLVSPTLVDGGKAAKLLNGLASGKNEIKRIIEGFLNDSGEREFKGSNNATRAEFTKVAEKAVCLFSGDEETFAIPSFSDVLPDKHWAFNYVEFAKEKGLVKGYEDGFRPDQNITKIEAIAILNRINKTPVAPSTCAMAFTDVPADHWGYADAHNAYCAGIAMGDGQGHLDPNSPMTRDEMVTFIYNLFASIVAKNQ